MKKTRIATTSLLLLLLTVTTLMLNARSAEAANYNIDWGHMKRYMPDYEEMNLEQGACFAVKNMFSYRSGWDSWYVYGELSTEPNLLNTIDWRQRNDVWASDFWVGDFYGAYVEGYQLVFLGWYWNEGSQQWEEIWVQVYDGYRTMHYFFYSDQLSYDPMDDHLFGTTIIGPYSKQHITVIWTCSCANFMTDPDTGYQCYGFIDNQNHTNEVGMPLAWTARGDLSFNGYSNPDSTNYCYIGFKGFSKPLKEDIGSTGYKYFGFVTLFYTRLTLNTQQYSVKQSLDYASQIIWDEVWYNTPLRYGYEDEYGEWCFMNVFGNSNLHLP